MFRDIVIFVLGMGIGGSIGVLITALMVAASRKTLTPYVRRDK